MAETQTYQEEFEYQAEMKQLLHLIIHALYTHPEIFLRELISNASDALNKLRFLQLTGHDILDPDLPLRISIQLDPEARTLVITDTGIGMTHDDLVHRIGSVASSGTLAFLEETRRAGKAVDAGIIGQFGVGFYSAFMVAGEVTIETRHADPESRAYRWFSTGEGTFTVEPLDREERGTTIKLKLKDDAAEFSQESRVRQIVRKYSNFVDFPIYLGDAQVNTVKALWRKQKSDVSDEELTEFYKFVSHDHEAPLGHLHLAIEGRVNFRALLFIPSSRPPLFFQDDHFQGLHLYTNNVFIQENTKELLPEYLRFVRGVVDTEDLPLNVSRETTQSNPVIAKIRSILTGKILTLLSEWAEKETEKYDSVFRNFGSLMKTGITSDFANREQLINLIRFESTRTKPGEYTSLRSYVDRMKDDQKEIYYVLGDHRELLEKMPNLEYFKKHDIEVLLLTDPVDVFVIPSIPVFDEKHLVSIEKADLDLQPDEDVAREALAADEIRDLVSSFKKTLGDRVEDVVASKRLVHSAATLVVGKEGIDPQMERIMKMMQQDIPPVRRILEINPGHVLIKNLAALQANGKHDELVEKVIMQLYEGALLVEGSLTQPAVFFDRMTELMTEATSKDIG